MADGPIRIDAAGRTQRLLAILRWAASAPDGMPTAELCERFGLALPQLVRELEMAMMVGGDSANFHDMPFEVWFEEDLVFVRLHGLDQPLRLTPEEGLALVASADALVDDEPADSPLRRGLAKVAGVLGVEPGDAIDVELHPLGGPMGQLADQAVARRRLLRFRYWTYGRDEVAERTVDPWLVFQASGSWYLVGRDVAGGGERRFRIDRISDPVVLDDEAGPIPAVIDTSVAVAATSPKVTIDLPAPARWVVESFPVDRVEELGEGRLRVELAAAGRSWVERLLLRIGPEATVVAIDEELGDAEVLADAARRLLARYRVDPVDASR